MTKIRPKKATTVSVINGEQFPIDGQSKATEKDVRSEEISFLYGLKPIINLSRVFGLFPFSIIRDSSGGIREPRVTKWDALWFIVSLVMYTALTYLVHIMKPLKPASPTYVLRMGDNLLLFIEFIFGLLILIIDMFNRFKIVGVLKKFTQFDAEMATVPSFQIAYAKVQFDYQKDHRSNWLCSLAISILLPIFLGITSLAYNYYEIDYSIVAIFHYYPTGLLETTIPTVPLLLYIVLLRNLKRRFELLNTLLRNRFLIGKTVKMSVNIRKEDSISNIKFFGRQHSFLTSIMDHINSCFAFQIMLNSAVTLVYSVLTFYTFYRYILQRNDSFMELSLVHLGQETIFLTCTVTAIYSADQVTSEGRMTSRILHEIINSCNDPDITTTLAQLCLQTQYRYPVATCGLFIFDWTLLFTMGAATTTYLTIILNFELPRNLHEQRTATAS